MIPSFHLLRRSSRRIGLRSGSIRHFASASESSGHGHSHGDVPCHGHHASEPEPQPHTTPAFELSKQERAESFMYCKDNLRKHDLLTLTTILRSPQPVREQLLILRAFDLELYLVQDNVSKLDHAIMRYEWWRTAIDRSFKGDPPKHPTIRALAGLIADYPLPQRWFTRMIEAQQNKADRGLPTVHEMEAWAEATHSSVLYLSLNVMGIKDANADHVASHLGKAIALSTLLKRIAGEARKGRVFIPSELTEKHKLSRSDVLKGQDSQELHACVYDIACLAHSHLSHAREMRSTVDELAVAAFLEAVPCGHFLSQLQKTNFHIFEWNAKYANFRGGIRDNLSFQFNLFKARIQNSF
eukprot:g30876.t1